VSVLSAINMIIWLFIQDCKIILIVHVVCYGLVVIVIIIGA